MISEATGAEIEIFQNLLNRDFLLLDSIICSARGLLLKIINIPGDYNYHMECVNGLNKVFFGAECSSLSASLLRFCSGNSFVGT